MAKKLDRTGEQAFSFNLTDEDGNEATLADFSDSWLLMVFHRHLG